MNTNNKARMIFLEAIEQHPPEKRAEFITTASDGDVDLRMHVERLLHSQQILGSFHENGLPVDVTFAQPATDYLGTQIGPYKLLEQIGEGGMGTVYVAEQKEPVRRKVALKLIKPGMDSHQVVARFEAERQALAMMNHPNIAKVLDAGTTAAGRPYFAMELVKGTPITEFCDQRKLDTRERLQLFITVCQAVQHAHQKGLIHRDLKPSNVLVEIHDVKPVPKVIDFGVAKAIGQQLTEKTLHTGTSQMIGTPLYMSPEQAGLSSIDVDTRSDIYSLGVLLYEILTGHTPFESETLRNAGFDEMRRLICEVDPPRPSARISTLKAQALSTVSDSRKAEPHKLSQQLRGELDWIVMKALEKDRNRRYESASALAADVQRYLDDRPVEACPPSASYRFSKFARKNRVILTTAALVATTMLIGTGVSAWQAIRATEAEKQTDRQRQLAVASSLEAQSQASQARLAQAETQLAKQEADRQRNAVTQNLYYADMRLGLVDWSVGNVARLSSKLLSHVPISGNQDNRGWEWYYLLSLCHHDERTLMHHSRQVNSVGFSPDGRYLASTGSDGMVYVYDSTNWRTVQTWQGESVWGASWSPDSQRLAWTTTSPDDRCFVGEVESGESITLAGYSGANRAPIWSPDSKHVASRGGGDMRVWDIATGSSISVFPQMQVGAMTWRDDGTLMMLSPDGKKLNTWNAASGADSQAVEIQGMTRGSWSPDKTRIACGTGTGICRVYDTANLSVVSEWKAHTGGITTVEWHPDGKHLATAGSDHLIQLWDPATGSNLLTLRGHLNQVISLAWEPAGLRLASGGMEGMVKVWSLPTSPQPREIVGHRGGVRGIAWSEDGKSLTSVGISDGTIARWNAHNGQMISKVQLEVDSIGQISSDGKLSAITPRDNKQREISIRDGSSGEVVQTLTQGTIRAAYSAFSSDASKLAITDRKNLEILELRNHKMNLHVIGQQFEDLSWSPDGQLLAVAGRGDPNVARYGAELHAAWVHVFETAKYHRILKVQHGASWVAATAVCWSPNGKQLVSGDANGLAEVWEVATGRKLVSVQLHAGRINDLAWSPNAQRVASSSEDGTLRIWDPTSGQELMKLDVQSDEMKLVAWSPDGRRLAGTTSLGAIDIWDASDGFQFEKSESYACELVKQRLDEVSQQWAHGPKAELIAQCDQIVLETEPKLASFPRWVLASLERLERTTREAGLSQEAIHLIMLIRRLGKDFYLENELGNLLAATNELDEAIAAYEKAIRQNKNNWAAYGNLGIQFLRLGKLDEGIFFMQEAVRLNPTHTRLWCNLGQALCSNGRVDEAIACFRRAIELDTRDFKAYSDLGNTLRIVGLWDEANLSLRKAIELKSDAPDSHSYLGRLHLIMGRVDDAIASHREAIRLNKEIYECYADLGDALQANGQLDEAITSYRESIRLLKLAGTVVHHRTYTNIQGNPVGVYIKFGNALHAKGEREEAATCYQEAIDCFKQRADPSQRFDANSFRQIAWLFGTCPDLRFRNADEALAMARKSQLLSPQDVQTWNTLGVCFYRVGNWLEAIDALQKSIDSRQGGDSVDWFFLAMAHCQLDHRDEPRVWYYKAVEWMDKHQPNNEELMRFRAEADELLGIYNASEPVDAKKPANELRSTKP